MSSPTHATAPCPRARATAPATCSSQPATPLSAKWWRGPERSSGANPSNPNFLTGRHPLRAPGEHGRGSPEQDRGEIEIWRGTRATARHPVVTTAPRAHPSAPTVPQLPSAVARARQLVRSRWGSIRSLRTTTRSTRSRRSQARDRRDHPGVFSIVGGGVLPLSTVIKARRAPRPPVPHPLASTHRGQRRVPAQLVDAPPGFMRYLRFLCVADGSEGEETRLPTLPRRAEVTARFHQCAAAPQRAVEAAPRDGLMATAKKPVVKPSVKCLSGSRAFEGPGVCAQKTAARPRPARRR